MDVLNPDSVVLQQVEGHWQQLAMLILWKARGREPLSVTVEEIEAFRKAFEPGIPVLLTHGHADSLEFKIVTEADAARIVAYDRTRRGTA